MKLSVVKVRKISSIKPTAKGKEKLNSQLN